MTAPPCLICRARVIRNTGGGRGLCPRCYDRMKTEVERGRVTWATLEACGLARPPIVRVPVVGRRAWNKEAVR